MYSCFHLCQKMVRVYLPAVQMQVTVTVANLQLSLKTVISIQPSTEEFSFPGISRIRRFILLYFAITFTCSFHFLLSLFA